MDIFDFAMEKEKQAEKLYRELASRADDGVKKILTMLADDEAKHHDVVKNMKEHHPEMADTHVLKDAKEVFKQMVEERRNIDPDTSELELYNKALDWEKKSEEFYTEKSEQSIDEKNKKLFEKLAGEEHKHYIMVRNIIDFVTKPKQYLDDAEWARLDE